MHPALFYRPGERLSLPELGAARLDGHVVEVGEGFMPADTVEGAEARAAGVAGLVLPGTAACGPTAAWIHGAGDRPPVVHHVRRTSSTRRRVPFAGRVIHHERRAPAHELQDISGVSVVTLVPTAVELAFSAAMGDDDGWLFALVVAHPWLRQRLRDEIAGMPRRPGRRGAARVVEELAAVPCPLLRRS
ncbi:SAM-dependent methyltransferase [Microbacterium sp. NPDC058342]|uniref:SAM-dependent methyltransferase n=1 Tax=Microbacterium sp. NPDC058342 TaxID=3346454 RepID=UPI00364CE795